MATESSEVVEQLKNGLSSCSDRGLTGVEQLSSELEFRLTVNV